MLIAFFVAVEAAGAGVAEGKLLPAVFEVVFRQQEQAQGVQQTGFAQIARPQNQPVMGDRNFHVTEAGRVHQNQAANAKSESAWARL